MRFVPVKSIVVSFALQHMVFSELACFETCNPALQVPDEFFSVISQIAPPSSLEC
jgi:hypothetical protein